MRKSGVLFHFLKENNWILLLLSYIMVLDAIITAFYTLYAYTYQIYYVFEKNCI